MESKLSPEMEEAVREANQALLEFYVCEEERDEDGQAVAEDNVVPILRSLVLRATQETAKRGREVASRALCGPCAEGWKVERGFGEPPLWYHPTTAEHGAVVCPCSLAHEALRKEFGLDD